MEMERGFTRRFHLGNSIRSDPILEAIFDNNVAQFTTLMDDDSVTNAAYLFYIIKLHRREMFDHLLNFANFDPDCPDNVGRNTLMGLANIPESSHYALTLINRGANVRWRDGCGFTYLHMAAKTVDVDNTSVAKAVIEKGADVNALTNRGETPLFIACEEGNYPFSCLLLYYGADATIVNDKGILPLAVTSRWVSPDLQPRLQELLFDYTFDDDKAVVSLATLVDAMIAKTPLFSNIVENISEVTYDKDDLEHFCGSLKYLMPQNLRLFMSKFSDIVKELINDYRLLIQVVELGWICDLASYKDILDVFIESELFPEMVQASDPTYSTIACLVEIFNQRLPFTCANTENNSVFKREELTKIVCVMLTHGLGVTSLDLDTVFQFYGYCDLFRILLHMEVQMIKVNGPSVASLYYNLETSIDDVLRDVAVVNFLYFFNNPKLKELCLTSDNEKLVAKAKNMPAVPSLVELSRNTARKFIVKRYNIQNSRQFYTVLKWLPIGEVNKKIIALERKLYH